jgi:hypothetical protein
MQPDVITSHARATVSLVLRGTCPRLRVLQFQDWYHTLAALQLPVLSPSSLAHRSLSAILLLSGPVIGQDGVLIQPIVATASLRFHHIETIGAQAGPFCSLFYGICLLLARTGLVPRTPTPHLLTMPSSCLISGEAIQGTGERQKAWLPVPRKWGRGLVAKNITLSAVSSKPG